MNLTDLLEEFNVVIDTAEGLTELRTLILGLAVRGKLVPQDPNDEPASELLKKIEAEKERLYEEGEIRKPKKIKSINSEELPFKIPENWNWARLSQTSITINGDRGKNYPSLNDTVEEGIPFINAGNLMDGFISKQNMRFITDERYDLLRSGKIQENDILYCLRGSLGKMGIVRVIEKGAIASSLIIIRTLQGFNINYIYSLLASPHGEYLISKYDNGTAQPNLAAGSLRDFEIPIPPLAEQHRIVQKLEYLFAEVDELEAKLKRQTKLDEKLQKAVNAEVQQAPDAEASKSAWTFITSNFETLYHTPEAIDNLKKNILNEAVRGRLVPQNPDDEPASELLKKIEAEKQRLYDEGEIRKPKKLSPVEQEEIPFEIPESWEWVKLGNIIQVSSGDGLTKSKMEEGEIPVFGGNGISGYHNEYNRGKETLVIGRVGYYCGATHITPSKSWVTDNAFITKFPEQYLYIHFLNWALRATDLQQNEGSTAQPVISGRKIYPIPFALPPLEEQYRIVRRIEELFAICDRFKEQLEQRENVNDRLVKGLVQEVLEGS